MGTTLETTSQQIVCPICGEQVACDCSTRLGQMMLILWQNREKLDKATKGKLTLYFAGDKVHASLEDQLTP